MTKSPIPLLIIEDDQEMLELLAQRLDASGFCVTAVRHPKHALKAAVDVDFPLALVDRCLPEMSGVDLMRELRSRLPQLRVVMLSGCDDPFYEKEALQHGAFAYLRKPCRLATMEQALYQALQPQQ